MTPTEFLTARYDEEEAVARAAHVETVMPVVWSPELFGQGPFVNHVARHDPAHVLADIAAKRAIVALHVPLDNPNVVGPARCAECGGNDVRPDAMGVLEDHPWAMPWPCPTLRAMLQPFAEHPDFDERWTAP